MPRWRWWFDELACWSCGYCDRTLGSLGVSGGFVASRTHWIDVIRSSAPSFIFTTSLSLVPLLAP